MTRFVQLILLLFYLATAFCGDLSGCASVPAQQAGQKILSSSALAPQSFSAIFVCLERYSRDTSYAAYKQRMLKAYAVETFLRDPVTVAGVFAGRIPQIPAALQKFLGDFIVFRKVLVMPEQDENRVTIAVTIDGHFAELYFFRDPTQVEEDADLGLSAEQVPVVHETGFWLNIIPIYERYQELVSILLWQAKGFVGKDHPELSKELGDLPAEEAVSALIHGQGNFSKCLETQLVINNPEMPKAEVRQKVYLILQLLADFDDSYNWTINEYLMESGSDHLDLADDCAREAVAELLHFSEYVNLRNQCYYASLSQGPVKTLGFVTSQTNFSSLWHNPGGPQGMIIDHPAPDPEQPDVPLGRSRQLAPMTDRPQPTYGEVIARHAFSLWQEMRRSGYLGAEETFVVGEIGGGIGFPLIDFWLYVCYQAFVARDEQWRMFYEQLQYRMYDFSGSLVVQQQQNLLEDLSATMGREFAGEFWISEKTVWTAMDFLSNRSVGEDLPRHKGFLFSHEFLDDQGFSKIRVAERPAKTALLVPSIDVSLLARLLEGSSSKMQLFQADDQRLQEKYNLPETPDRLYVSKEVYREIYRMVYSSVDMTETKAKNIFQFLEVYVDVRHVPEDQEFVQRQEQLLASRRDRGRIRQFIYPRSQAYRRYLEIAGLQYDLVIINDYGSPLTNMLETMENPPLRVCGRGHTKEEAVEDFLYALTANLTADVDFDDLSYQGATVGWETVFSGSEGALIADAGISEEAVETATPFLQAHYRALLSSRIQTMVLRKNDAHPSVGLPLLKDQPAAVECMLLTEETSACEVCL